MDFIGDNSVHVISSTWKTDAGCFFPTGLENDGDIVKAIGAHTPPSSLPNGIWFYYDAKQIGSPYGMFLRFLTEIVLGLQHVSDVLY